MQSARQVRFTNLQEIIEMEAILKAYILEAVEVEKSGLKVTLKKATEYSVADEFQTKLDEILRIGNSFLCPDAGAAESLLVLFFCAQTIQNPGVKG